MLNPNSDVVLFLILYDDTEGAGGIRALRVTLIQWIVESNVIRPERVSRASGVTAEDVPLVELKDETLTVRDHLTL